MPLSITCLATLLGLPLVPATAAPATLPATRPATAPLTAPDGLPDWTSAAAPNLTPSGISASDRGSFLYLKLGFGVSRADTFSFAPASVQQLGFEDVTQDIFGQDGELLIDDALLRSYGSQTVIDLERAAGPMVVAGMGADLSLGRDVWGNRFRPRLEAEYSYRSVAINNASAPIFFTDALRDEVGGLVLQNNPFTGQLQTVAGESGSFTRPLGDSEIDVNTFALHGVVAFEVIDRVRPYAGAGLGLAHAAVRFNDFDTSDWSPQIVYLGGVLIAISEDVEVDVGVRYTTAEFELIGDEIDLDAWTVSAALNIRL